MLGDRFPSPSHPKEQSRVARLPKERVCLACETTPPHQALRMQSVQEALFRRQLKLVSDCTERVTALSYKIATRTIRQLTAVFPRRVALSASSAEDQHS